MGYLLILLGHDGGQVVRVFAFYSDNLSLNHAKAYSILFFERKLFESTGFKPDAKYLWSSVLDRSAIRPPSRQEFS